MRNLVLFSLLSLFGVLETLSQSVNDDLYFVPKKDKKVEQPVTAAPARSVNRQTVTEPVQEVRFSNGKLTTVASTTATSTTWGIERDVDEYNRRYSYATDDVVADGEVVDESLDEVYAESEGSWNSDFQGTDEDYQYATRLIRFRSPRVAVPVSSPLYWDIVYTWPASDWNVYSDGLYAYAFPTYSNPAWWDWHVSPWTWSLNIGWGHGWHSGWGVSFGWHSGWYDPWYPYYHHHHHHHWGPAWAGGGHIPGGWNSRFYYDDRPKMASRSMRTRDRQAVRSSRQDYTRSSRSGSSRTEASRSTSRSSRSSAGRVVSGNSSSRSVRAGSSEGQSRQNGVTTSRRTTTTRKSEATSGRPTGSNYNRPSSTRSSSSSVRSSSSSSSRSSRSSSSSVSRSNSSRSSSPSFSSGSSSRSSSSFGGGSSRGSRSGGGGGSRSGRR